MNRDASDGVADSGVHVDRDAAVVMPDDDAGIDPEMPRPRPIPVACSSGGGSAFGDLPSGETEHTRRLAALEPGEWLELGPAAPDPVHGVARGRTWSSEMPFAEDLGGAFLFGEGVHGWWNEETGRYMDDLWFYDARAHRWLTAYPGFDTRNPPALHLGDDGFVHDENGPLPVSSMVHGYEMITYDSRRRLFLSLPCRGGYHFDVIPAERAITAMDGYTERGSPWMFDVEAMRWNRLPIANAPRSGYGDVLVYLASRDETFFWTPGAAPEETRVYFYDNESPSWRHVDAAGPPPPFGIEPTVAYDPTRERIYMGGGQYPITPEGHNPFFIYDLTTDTWIDPAPEGTPGGQEFGTNSALMHYDAAADVVLLFRHGRNPGVWRYDIEANTWSQVDTTLPAFREAVNGFYDPCQNVHIIHEASDSTDDGTFWAYRH